MWVAQLPARASSVYTLAFAPDGRTLYSGDGQGYVLAWDLAGRTHRVLFRLPYSVNRIVGWLWPSPDGSRLLVQDDFLLRNALDPDVPLLNPGPGERGWWKYMLPDGRRVAKTDPDRGWRLDWWDVDTGLRVPVPAPMGGATNLTFHALLADGVTLLTYSGTRRETALWDVRTGERLGVLPRSPENVYPYHLWLSPDGGTFALARENQLWLYDIPSRSLRHQVKAPRQFQTVAFQPRGRLMAAGHTGSHVSLWDAIAGQMLQRFDWHCGQILTLAFAPDGQTCAAGAYAKIVVWDVDVS
jgi:WD40 repeat protein